jgi:hypothetical protein
LRKFVVPGITIPHGTRPYWLFGGNCKTMNYGKFINHMVNRFPAQPGNLRDNINQVRTASHNRGKCSLP